MKRKIIVFIAVVLAFSAANVNMASALLNPAYVYCREMGYEHKIVTDKDGAQRGYCVLPDNMQVDEWQFLQGKVKEAEKYGYCAKMGYKSKNVPDSGRCSKFVTSDCQVCVMPDGSEVEVTELMKLDFRETTCGDGNCGFPENSLSCPKDCITGGFDMFCDGKKDGKCDPDCRSLKDDPDCLETNR